MPTGSIYEHYEAEYLACTKRAMENMERIPELLPGVERESLVASTSKAIESAEEVVQQMELEARSASGDAKREGLAQAQDYKVALMNMRTQLKQARASDKANERAREALLEGTDRALRMESEAEHARMAATTTRLQKGTDTIRAACQVAIETEAVGASIMSDLENNRQTIEHARSTLGYANQGLAKSKRLLQGMGRRARCNFDLLRSYVSRARACPLAGCEASLTRSHDIVRDDALKAQLSAVPKDVDVVCARRRGEDGAA